ncbi:MAG TPA: DEAD/DEAH box helicase, partial [Patescibacteria group bacterium]|nr:DEAD/DEAH box helicase [Patescibacteria group bacterium]
MFTFDTPLSSVTSIKKQTLAKLARLDVLTVSDMLYHFPHRYEDYSGIRPVSTLAPDEKCTLEGRVIAIKASRTWKKKMLLTEATLEDASGQIRLIWFNQRFVAQTLKSGMSIRASGKVTRDKRGLLIHNPAFERSSRDATHTGRLVPIYPETAGLTSKFFRWQLTNIFPKLTQFPDPVPTDILTRLHLPSLKQALFYLHFPQDTKHALIAQKRFAFDEMFFVQLKALQLKTLFETARGIPLSYDDTALQTFIHSFAFTLTNAQRKASLEILTDLGKTRPMNRLLNGDVGSGKTIVAALAAWVVAEQKSQTVILAPTEVLARQHFDNLSRVFSHTQHTLALLTGSYHILDDKTVTRPTLLQAIQTGIPNIIIGTHALLEQDVIFEHLALIVVDEQHRFGVSQRARLQELSYTSQD